MEKLKKIFNFQIIEFITWANQFLDELKRLPILKKVIPDSVYGLTTLKYIVGIFAVIGRLLWNFAKKAIYFLIFMVVPAFIIMETRGIEWDAALYKRLIYHMFLFMNVILGGILNEIVFVQDDKDYIMVKLMRTNASYYYRYKMFATWVPNIIAMFVAALVCQMGILGAFIITLLYAFSRTVGQSFVLRLDKLKGMDNIKVGLNVFLVIGGVVLAYVLPAIRHELVLDGILKNPLVLVIIAFLACLALIDISDNYDYSYIAQKTIKPIGNEEDDEIKLPVVKVEEKQFTKEELTVDKYANYKGYDYLNRKFFERHKGLFRHPMIIKLVAIALVTIIPSIIFMYWALTGDLTDKMTNGAHNVLSNVIPSALVFIMYMMTNGASNNMSFFYNCDICMLKYGFYREPGTIVKNFVLRLKKTIWYNIIPAGALCLGIVIFALASGNIFKVYMYIPFMICALVLSVFYSVFYLFLYYMCQPFVEQGKVTGVLYNLLNSVIYIIAYMNFSIMMDIKCSMPVMYTYTGVVIAITVVFSVLAVLLVRKFAPKTFRLK
ncbi:MAG: hypothetical protein E7252_10230 [Lachnospira sp.]|nr:hypothetical protein [Lachnospira sp.]